MATKKRKEITLKKESYYVASQWQLIRLKLTKHKLAILGGIVLAIFYLVATFCEFFSTYDIYRYDAGYIYHPPQRIRFFDEEGFHLWPFVYGLKGIRNPVTFRMEYSVEKTKKYPLYFFIRGDEYKLWNLFPTDIHFFGVKEPGRMFLFGADKLGRDLFSRNLYASRISLSIGLVGVFLSFVLGLLLGGISGYYGGRIDMFIQRIVEFLTSIPVIPLWMALSAALPPHWSTIKVYFGIVIILSLLGWCPLARAVRGKLLELREEDFAMAAKITGASERRIIIRHLLPSFFSYLMVSLTLAIPGMILGETALSFLGLGIRPPAVSWGVLLGQAQNLQVIVMYPWFLITALFVILTVLAFNFVGDGLRDAADPYK